MKQSNGKAFSWLQYIALFCYPRPVSIKEAIKIKCTILFKSPSSANTGSQLLMSILRMAQSRFASLRAESVPLLLLSRTISGGLVQVRNREKHLAHFDFPPLLLLPSHQRKERWARINLTLAQRSEWWGVWVSVSWLHQEGEGHGFTPSGRERKVLFSLWDGRGGEGLRIKEKEMRLQKETRGAVGPNLWCEMWGAEMVGGLPEAAQLFLFSSVLCCFLHKHFGWG